MSPARAAVLAGAGGLLMGAVGTHVADASASRAAIESVVRDYLLSHPEIIPEALGRLQSQQTAGVIRSNARALTVPFAGAWAGNAKGDATLVMFTDYSCGYCRASAPIIERLLASDPRLKVVWREIPVLGPDSEAAARLALAAAEQGRYLPVHHALFAGGHPDAARLAAVAHASGLDPLKLAAPGDERVTRELAANVALATRLGIEGTPAFVIGDQMLTGAVGYDRLVQAIAAARAG